MRRIFFGLALLSIVFVSCQKESSFEIPGQENADPRLEGEWDFLYAHITGTTRTRMEQAGESVESISINDYETLNNQGVFRFMNGMVEVENFSYDIDTELRSEFYENDVLQMELDVPFQISMPAYNVKGPYQRIGQDSLYFPEGSFISVDNSGTGVADERPSGLRYAFSNDTLYMYSGYNNITRQTENGIVTTTRIDANVEYWLKKR